MITWKRVGFLALAVPAVLLLAFGPRNKRDIPAAADGKPVVVVEYWEKWTGDEGKALQDTVDIFNNTRGREKGIFVNLLSTSGITQKTLVATAGGVPPDIAGLWDAYLAQMAALDSLTPLDELAAKHGITEATYKKVFWDECHYDGKLYALISTPYCYAMYYNAQIFRDNADKLRAAGLNPETGPKTIDELDRYAKALDVIEDGRIKRLGYLPLEPGWDIGFLPYAFGGFWWDKTGQKYTFTDPAVVKAYSWMRSYSERLGKGAVTDFRQGMGNYDSPQNPFLAGTQAIVSQGTFFANIIRHQKPSLVGNWVAMPFPGVTENERGSTNCTADILAIPKGAKHPNEAFEFIAWLHEQKNMEKLCMDHCKLSPLAKVSENYLKHNTNPYIQVFEDLANGKNAVQTPSIETLPDAATDMGVFVADVGTLRATAQDGLKELQTRMSKKQQQFVEKQRLWKK